MSIWILQPDAQGNCCDCTSRVEPCDSCSGHSGLCCTFNYGSTNLPLSGCYEKYSVSGFVEFAGVGGTASMSDAGPVDSFAPGHITLSRNTTYSVNSIPGSTANASSTAQWAIGISTDGNFTISAAGTITYHDCPTANAILYPLTSNDGCGNFSSNPIFFNFATSICNIHSPYSFSQSYAASIPAGSYGILFTFGPGFVGSQNGTCVFPSCNGAVNVNAAIVGAKTVPLPLDTDRPLTCNKTLLPFGTEAEGGWYASLPDAQAAIAQAVSCLMVTREPGQFGSYGSKSASAGTNSLTMAATYTNVGFPYSSVIIFGGATLTQAGVISAQYSFPIVSSSAEFIVYDSNGLAVFNQNLGGIIGGSHTFTTSVLPAGRYSFQCVTTCAVGANNPNSTTIVISATHLVANTLQALYDVGLDCPARLDCS